jgi:hypothetical protein
MIGLPLPLLIRISEILLYFTVNVCVCGDHEILILLTHAIDMKECFKFVVGGFLMCVTMRSYGLF